MPQRDAGAVTTLFFPAAFSRAFTKAKDHATQHRRSSARATI
jgi:hypothetical protein